MGRLKTFQNKAEPIQPAKDYNDSRSTQPDQTKLKNRYCTLVIAIGISCE